MRTGCLWIVASALAAWTGAAGAGDAAATTEPPYAGDPIEVTAEKRAEIAFRGVQLALERSRSDRAEDADTVVCVKQTPTGSHRPVINCATNRFWLQIRSRSLASGLGGVDGIGAPQMSTTRMMFGNTGGNDLGRTGLNSVGPGGGNGARKREDDRVFTMTLADFNKLKARYGELPPELREASRAGSGPD